MDTEVNECRHGVPYEDREAYCPICRRERQADELKEND